MKGHGKFLIGVLALTAVTGVLLPRAKADAQADAEKTRKELRQQGFKTDPMDFNSPASDEMDQRIAALGLTNRSRGPVASAFLNNADLMTPVSEHAAAVIWKEAELPNPAGFEQYSYEYEKDAAKNVWPLIRDQLAEERTQLDKAAGAVLSGPFYFHLNLRAGGSVLLPHLAGMRRLMEKFGYRTLLALHDGDKEAAWTNLLAATRLVTTWETEPIEVSQSVRFNNLETAYEITWQALQSENWPEERLAQLQREWESLDILKRLPDIMAFGGASDVAMCRAERLRPVPTNGPMSNPLKDPRQALREIERKWEDKKYRNTGTYVDEKDMLLFYRDRVVEARNASKSHSWAEMRGLPGVTNEVLFQSQYANHNSPARMARNQRRMMMARIGGGVGLMGRAAEAEARRRLIITAIALERFHVRQGAYPKSLGELAPEFVKTEPMDFMNGKPLRYLPDENGHYLLYSVGLDGRDNGGKMSWQINPDLAASSRLRGRATTSENLVWPEPAAAMAVKAHEEEKENVRKAWAAAQQQKEADREAQIEISRQAAVKKLLADSKHKKAMWPGSEQGSKEPAYQGQALSKYFYNEKAHGTNAVSLDELLTLTPVVTGNEPEVVTYQLPISYDAVTNMLSGEVALLMDSDPDEKYPRPAEWQGRERATNGDCRISWNASTEALGQHALQAMLGLDQGMDKPPLMIRGPVLSFYSTNLCQFFPQSSLFNDTGANLYARLPESNGVYSIEIKTRTGTHVRTITGSTTNGTIDCEWDLLDDKGTRFTNNSFVSFFTVKLPGSGRSQTLRQGQNKIGTGGD